VTHECRAKDPLHPDSSTSTNEKDGVQVESRLQWCVDCLTPDSILGFATTSDRRWGASHIGAQTGLTRTFNTFAKARQTQKDAISNLAARTIREGLTAVLLVEGADLNSKARPNQARQHRGSCIVDTVVAIRVLLIEFSGIHHPR